MKKVLSVILALTFVFLMIQPATVPASAALWVPVTSVKLNAASAKWAVGKSGALQGRGYRNRNNNLHIKIHYLY